jgi:hypothetical protein
MLTLLSDVRYREQNGKHLLAASISAFDPKPIYSLTVAATQLLLLG